MAQVIVSKTPQGARDEIVAWLRWQAKRHKSRGTALTDESARQLALGRRVEELADELADIPCVAMSMSISEPPETT